LGKNNGCFESMILSGFEKKKKNFPQKEPIGFAIRTRSPGKSPTRTGIKLWNLTAEVGTTRAMGVVGAAADGRSSAIGLGVTTTVWVEVAELVRLRRGVDDAPLCDFTVWEVGVEGGGRIGMEMGLGRCFLRRMGPVSETTVALKRSASAIGGGGEEGEGETGR
jgi:hypothetical protein